MTNYGTIPTSSSEGTNEFNSTETPQVHNGRRPWKEMVRSLNLPSGFGNTIKRMKTNLAYFRTNYMSILILILFLSFLFHPVSGPVFLALLINVLLVSNLSNRMVMICLLIFSVITLLFNEAAWNIITSFFIEVVVVTAHAILRNTDDLSLDEEVALAAGIRNARPWKEMLRSLNLPSGFRNTIERIKTNIDYFKINYVVILMLILCLSFLCHPISFAISWYLYTYVWMFFYYLDKETSSVRKFTIVLGIISVIMLSSFIDQAAWINMLSTLLIEALVVAAHASFRKTDDLFLVLDEGTTGADSLAC